MPTKTAADLAPEDWKHYQPFSPTENVSPSSGSFEDAMSVAQGIAKELIHGFGAKKVKLFGSLARSDYHRRSDIDLAVWGIPAPEFYRAVAFATGFSKIWKVDLVDAEECGDSLSKAIQSEGIEL
jgi:predicted nucleotidyltransferase